MKNKFFDVKAKSFRTNAIKLVVLNQLLSEAKSPNSPLELKDSIWSIILHGIETDIVQELLANHPNLKKDEDGYIDFGDYMDRDSISAMEDSIQPDIEFKATVMNADIYGDTSDFKRVVVAVMLDQCDSIKISSYVEMPNQEKDANTEYKMDVKIGFDGDEWIVPTLRCRTIYNMPVLLNGDMPELDDTDHTEQLIDAISAIAYYTVKRAHYADTPKPAATNEVIAVSATTVVEEHFTLFESGDFKTEVHLSGECDPELGMMDTSVIIGDKVLFVIDGNFKEDFKNDFLALVKEHAI